MKIAALTAKGRETEAKGLALGRRYITALRHAPFGR
jgi:hypothetical protein